MQIQFKFYNENNNWFIGLIDLDRGGWSACKGGTVGLHRCSECSIKDQHLKFCVTSRGYFTWAAGIKDFEEKCILSPVFEIESLPMDVLSSIFPALRRYVILFGEQVFEEVYISFLEDVSKILYKK